MSVLALAASALAAVASPQPHIVEISPNGAPVSLRYQADVTVKTAQKGAHVPSRGMVANCHWTASVDVTRGAGDAQRLVSREDIASGTLPGLCQGRQNAIARAVSAKAGSVEAHLARVAQADSAVAAAEYRAASAAGH